MAYYSELTSVQEVRGTYMGIVNPTDDALVRAFVREVSAEIETYAARALSPRIETRYYDAVRDVYGAMLLLDDDLLSITTLTNGDAATIAANQYVFEPRGVSTYWAVRLLNSSGVVWTYSTDPENAISVAGTWGYDCSWRRGAKSEWVSTGTTSGAIASTSATTFTSSAGAALREGWLLKIDSEFMYVSDIATNVITIARGVNGSTAATHSDGAAVSYWKHDAALEGLAKDAVAARYRLRDNPLADSFVALDGSTLAAPKDVSAWLQKRVAALGLVRMNV